VNYFVKLNYQGHLHECLLAQLITSIFFNSITKVIYTSLFTLITYLNLFSSITKVIYSQVSFYLNSLFKAT
jgi:hypothetical protein